MLLVTLGSQRPLRVLTDDVIDGNFSNENLVYVRRPLSKIHLKDAIRQAILGPHTF